MNDECITDRLFVIVIPNRGLDSTGESSSVNALVVFDFFFCGNLVEMGGKANNLVSKTMVIPSSFDYFSEQDLRVFTS
jgi:hypothetical protein